MSEEIIIQRSHFIFFTYSSIVPPCRDPPTHATPPPNDLPVLFLDEEEIQKGSRFTSSYISKFRIYVSSALCTLFSAHQVSGRQ